MHILALLGDDHLGDDLFGRSDIADAHSGGEDLGKRRAVDHDAVLVKGLDRGYILAGKAQLTVRIILEDHNAVFLAEVIDRAAALRRRGNAGRILKARDDIEQLCVVVTAQLILQIAWNNALIITLHADRHSAVGTECVERADEARLLAEHDIALVAERLAGKLDTLLTARNDDRGIKATPDSEFFLQSGGDRFTQRRITLGDAVLQRRRGLRPENVGGERCQCLYREGLGRRIARRKRNDARVGQTLEDLPDGRRAQICQLVRK